MSKLNGCRKGGTVSVRTRALYDDLVLTQQ
jgi:hypothetical protein